jgi:hypothetical protein
MRPPNKIDLQFYLASSEIDKQMLLSAYEVFCPISRILPIIEQILIRSNTLDLFEKNIHKINNNILSELINQGLINTSKLETLLSSAQDERQAVQVWEETKLLRNTAIGVLSGLMIDFVRRGQVDIPDLKSALEIKRIDLWEPDYYSMVSQKFSGSGLGQYLDYTKHKLGLLNSLLKIGIEEVIGTSQNLDITHPMFQIVNNLTQLVIFANHWRLTRRDSTQLTLSQFVARGVDSMTMVPYQLLAMIAEMIEDKNDLVTVLDIYSRSFPIIAIFASGDRELYGQLRRNLENTQGVFDFQYFQLTEKRGVYLRSGVLLAKEIEVRRNNFQFMLNGSIWYRGKPRIVSYCPAVAARAATKPNVVRDVFDWSLQLLGVAQQ